MKAASRYASGYGRRADEYVRVLDPTLEPAAAEVVRRAALTGCETVLDLATGTGAIARKLASRASFVIGVDVSAGMPATASTLSNSSIRFEVANAAALPFDDCSIDVVTCGLSLSHMPDVRAALREVRRVLRPHGGFVASSWGRSGENPAFAAVLEVIRRHAYAKPFVFGDILDEATWAELRRAALCCARWGSTP
jgi:ubiquinone/menaquinone biosynthesis C-methylase UbiE